jgi:hypothetical protein
LRNQGRRHQHQPPHLCRARRRELGGNERAEALAQQVDLSQAHGIEEVADRRGMLRDTRPRYWWVGIPEAW